MSLFNRSYLLTITNPPKFEPDPAKNYLEQLSDFVILTPRSVEAFNVTELRVAAKVRTSSNNSNSPYTEVLIYNATEEIRLSA